MTAVHISDGLYEALITPLLAANYELTATMTNDYQAFKGLPTILSNSPLMVRVFPGHIDALKCFTDVTGTPLTQASVTFSFTISFVDIWDNLHF